jgi:hypothetical protein
MASQLLILPLHQILSVQGLKVEAKPKVLNLRESSQGRAAMRVREVACLPSSTGLHLGWSQDRASPQWAKIDQSAYSETGRDVTGTDSDALMAPVIPVITCCKRNDHRTDEVPRCPLPFGTGVSATYKFETKGSTDASEAGMGALQPRLKGCRQRQSRSIYQRLGVVWAGGGRSERQNLRVPCGPPRFMGPVSPGIKATTWPGGTSSRQIPGSLGNRPQQPRWARKAVHTR